MKYLTSKQMAFVDEIAISKYNITIFQMMENAGRNLARFVSRLKPKQVIVFFGKGNNGAGGLVATRHLAIQGTKVTLIQGDRDLNNNVKHHLLTLRKMGITPSKGFKAKKGDVIIDALLGYNIHGKVREPVAELIKVINFTKSKGIKVVSLDLPSGLDPDTGKGDLIVKSDYVLTLALPKKGLKGKKNVYLANIGIPKEVYKELKLNIKDIFKDKDIIKIS